MPTSLPPCPYCHGEVGMRGFWITMEESCDHPCHAAAQDVVEAAVSGAVTIEGEITGRRYSSELNAAVAALLATLEEQP